MKAAKLFWTSRRFWRPSSNHPIKTTWIKLKMDMTYQKYSKIILIVDDVVRPCQNNFIDVQCFPWCFTWFNVSSYSVLYENSSKKTFLLNLGRLPFAESSGVQARHCGWGCFWIHFWITFLKFLVRKWFPSISEIILGVPDHLNHPQNNFIDCCSPSELFKSIRCLVDSIPSLFYFEGAWPPQPSSK